MLSLWKADRNTDMILKVACDNNGSVSLICSQNRDSVILWDHKVVNGVKRLADNTGFIYISLSHS